MGSQQLINQFLERTSAYSTREAGRFIGVSHERVNRWRNGHRPELTPETARAIQHFLALAPGSETDRTQVERAALLLAADRLEQVAAELRAQAFGKERPTHETVSQVKRAASAVKAARQGKPQKRAGHKGG